MSASSQITATIAQTPSEQLPADTDPAHGMSRLLGFACSVGNYNGVQDLIANGARVDWADE